MNPMMRLERWVKDSSRRGVMTAIAIAAAALTVNLVLTLESVWHHDLWLVFGWIGGFALAGIAGLMLGMATE